MIKEESLKPRMSDEEMAALMKTVSPVDPNPVNLGKFAKKLGYKRYKQMSNGKLYYYYIKEAM